jgi:ribosome recycling factor
MIRRVLGLGFATQSRWRVAVFCHFTKVTKKEQNKIDKGKEKQKVL